MSLTSKAWYSYNIATAIDRISTLVFIRYALLSLDDYRIHSGKYMKIEENCHILWCYWCVLLRTQSELLTLRGRGRVAALTPRTPSSSPLTNQITSPAVYYLAHTFGGQIIKYLITAQGRIPKSVSQ